MILELIEFNSPKGWSRAKVAKEARSVIPKWRVNKELLRKHFLLSLDERSVPASTSGPRLRRRRRRITRNGGSR